MRSTNIKKICCAIAVSCMLILISSAIEAQAATLINTEIDANYPVTASTSYEVTNSGFINPPTYNNGIDGASVDGVTVTVDSGGRIYSQGGQNNTANYNAISLGNNATINVNNGGTVDNAASININTNFYLNSAIVTGTGANITVGGLVKTDETSGPAGAWGYNNYSPGIKVGTGSTISVQSNGQVIDNAPGGSAIDIASNSTLTNAGTIQSTAGYLNIAAVSSATGNSIIVNNTGTITSNPGTGVGSSSISSVGVALKGSNCTINSSGTIQATGTGGTGIQVGGASGTETGNALNLFGAATVTGNLINAGATGGAIVNFGYTGSAADASANTKITGNIGSTGNTWNGEAWKGTSEVTGTSAFNTLQIDSGATLNLDSTSTASGRLIVNGTLNTFGATVGSLVGSGIISSNATGATLLNVGADNTSTIFSGTIQDGAPTTKILGLTKYGTGTLILTGTNTYTAGTLVSAGTLNVQSNGALTGSGISVNSGAILQLQGGITTTNAVGLTLFSAGDSGQHGGLESVSGANTYTGLVTLGNGSARINSDSGASLILSNTGTITGSGNTLTVGGAGNTTINSIIGTGTGGLTKDGTGTLILSRDNTYDGNTTISEGKLSITTAGGLGSTVGGTSVANAATLELAGNFSVGAENVTLAGGSTLLSSSGTNSISGLIQVTGTSTVNVATALALSGSVVGSTGSGFQILDKTGTGTLTLNGHSDNTSLATTVDDGTLVLAKTVTTDSGINATARLTVNGGTLQLAGDENRQILDTASVTLNGGTFDENGKNETIGTLELNGGTITGSGILTINSAAIDARSGSSSTILAGSQGLTKTTSGIVTLSGVNTYTGKTAINGGTLVISADSGLGTAPGSAVADQLSSNGGTLQTTADMTLDSNRGITLTGSGTTLSTNTGTTLTYNGIIAGSSSLTKSGTGTLSLGGANTNTGITNVNAGTLSLSNATGLGMNVNANVGAAGTLDINNVAIAQNITLLGGTLTGTGAGASLSGNITLGGNSTLGGTGTMALGGVIEGSGQGITKTGSGTITLSGINTYSGGTTISAGTLVANNSSALGAGAVINNATLDIGSTQLSGIGVYTQNTSGSKLKLTIDSPTTSGKISSSSAALVTTAGTVDVTIANNVYLPNNATFTIIDTVGSGVSVPGAINSLSTSRISFVGQASNGDLILTANRTASGFASLANNSNAQAAGTVLDNITTPSSDMTTVLNTLEGLSDAQTTSDLNTVGPPVNSGVLDNSAAALNNFIGASLERSESVLTAAAGNSANTGISSGDDSKLNGIWAKEYGSYLSQGTRKGIEGYNAWNAGTAIGIDRLLSDTFTLGVSGGYAYGHVSSDANSASTNISSGQGTIYAGYQDANIPYFIDAAGSFAWNQYEGKRDISIGGINRTANSSYDGQQYGTYLGGGYRIKLGKNIELTPLASIQWDHLRLAGYTETEAGSMNLSVNRQSYDILQSALGARISSQVKCKWGNFIPEFHVKWLYDFINDAVALTSTYTGGGTSFASGGAKPAKNGANLGGKLSFDLKNNISVIGECDTELRDQFVGVYGSVTLRYKF